MAPRMRDGENMFSRPLVREITVITVVKMVILIAAGLLVFGPGRVDVTATTVEARVLYSVLETLR